MKTNSKLGIVAISMILAVSATTALGAAGMLNSQKTHDRMGEISPRGGMMNMMRGNGGMMNMMRGMGGMMSMIDSCPMMRRNDSADSDTGRPNSQWRERSPEPIEKGG